MLHELTISNLGVIESARLALGPGLTVVTGETGAGKTMVLTGLAMILGDKVSPLAVRTGAAEAVAEAIVDIPEGSIRDALDNAGVTPEDDGTVVIARSVGATTRGRSVVGGRTVPQALLAETGQELVTVHGQADQGRLRAPSKQRELLDAYAGTAHLAALAEYRDAWLRLTAATATLAQKEAGASDARERAGRLRDDVAAIDAVEPTPGEDDALVAEAAVLANVETVGASAVAAAEILAGDGDATVVAALDAARRALAEGARHDVALGLLAERLAEHVYGAQDVASELTQYVDRLDGDPERLQRLHLRRSDLAALSRRLGRDIGGILEYREQARMTLAEVDDWDSTLERLRADVASLRDSVWGLAARLHDGRSDAGRRLAHAIRAELAHLAMPEADIAVIATSVDPGPWGADSIAMTMSPHPGAPHRPIADAASGGELSRIMLAVEVALAANAPRDAHTFVFDEVDAGVGGRAAIDVGRRLATLARVHQVVVVTHLAQVAAFADSHIVVHKASDGIVTRAQVSSVTGEDRVTEIARLLSGHEDSHAARAHALELLESASVAR